MSIGPKYFVTVQGIFDWTINDFLVLNFAVWPVFKIFRSSPIFLWFWTKLTIFYLFVQLWQFWTILHNLGSYGTTLTNFENVFLNNVDHFLPFWPYWTILAHFELFQTMLVWTTFYHFIQFFFDVSFYNDLFVDRFAAKYHNY